MEAQQHRMLWF